MSPWPGEKGEVSHGVQQQILRGVTLRPSKPRKRSGVYNKKSTGKPWLGNFEQQNLAEVNGHGKWEFQQTFGEFSDLPSGN